MRKLFFALLLITGFVANTLPANADTAVQFGAAFGGGNITAFENARNSGLPIVWAREFWQGTVPTSLAAWGSADAANNRGYRLWLSVDVSPTGLAAGNYDGQIAHFVSTLPAGTRLTFMHEPAVVRKHLTQELFARAFNHAATVVHNTVGNNVLTGPIDVRVHIIDGNYARGIKPALLDFIGVDGYDGINGGNPGVEFSTLASRQVAFLHNNYPGVPIGFAEFNTSRSTGRPEWIKRALTWAGQNNVSPMCLFAALSPYRLSQQELDRLGELL